MIKMIVMDMDGTLLHSDNTISEYTKTTLIKAQKQGIKVVLASGRSYRKLMQYANELKLAQYGGYLIEVNGIARYDLKNNQREVYHQLSKADATYIFQEVSQFEVEILGMGDESIYDYIPESMEVEKRAFRQAHGLPKDYPWTAGAFAFVYDNRMGYPKQQRITSGEDFPESLNKISVAHLPHKLEAQVPAIKARLQDRFWMGLTSPGWLEIMPKGVTKGSALQALAKELVIPMADIMAFGDGENDIEMLEAAGHAIVMENALANVKQYATHICPSNNEDGIAKTLDRFVFTNEEI